MQKPFEEEFALGGRGALDAPFWRRFVAGIGIRFRRLEQIVIDWEVVKAQGLGVLLQRLNEVLVPAAQRIQDLTSLGWLVAPSSTSVTLAAGEVATFELSPGVQRELFTPSPFVAVTRTNNPDDFAVARVLSYTRTTGVLDLLVDRVEGDPGPHADWQIAAVAGSVLSQLSMLEEAQEALAEAHATAEAVAADKALTSEDATNTLADRLATAADRIATAGHVAAAAASAAKLQGTSATMLTPSIASKTLATQPGKLFDVGTFVRLQSTASLSRWMFGQVTAYDTLTGALTVSVEAIGITVTAASSWTVAVAGARGGTGSTGPGVPAGGATGQILAKVSGADFDGTWINLPSTPDLYPIALSAPTASQTGVGAGGVFTFVGSDYASLYGFAQASRAVNIYLQSAPSVIVKTFTTSGVGTTVAATLTGQLSTSTAYLAEMVYTDTKGNIVKSAKVAFTTAAVFKPGLGQAYEGGYLAVENFQSSGFDIVMAAKSTEIQVQWGVNPANYTVVGGNSRTNGAANTVTQAAYGAANANSTKAAQYCDALVSGGKSDWVHLSVDEMLAVYVNRTAFAGAESFQTVSGSSAYWTSTEIDANNAKIVTFFDGAEASLGKLTSTYIRAGRRVAV